MLKLNEHKMEVLVCGQLCRKESISVDMLAVGNACIQLSGAVKFLRVHFEYDLSVEKQVSSIVKVCFLHLRARSLFT